VRLFSPGPTYRYRFSAMQYPPGPGVNYTRVGPLVFGFKQEEGKDGQVRTTFLDAGKNPPSGVAVRYFLPEKPEGDVTLTFLDEAGNELRTFHSKKEQATQDQEQAEDQAEAQAMPLGVEGEEGAPAQAALEEEAESEEREPAVPKEAGLNRFIWNMRLEDAHKVEGDESMSFFLAGPLVLPGKYQVRLTAGEQSWTQSFEILSDPRGHETPEGERAQHELLLKINDKLTQSHNAVNAIRDVKRQIGDWQRRLKGEESAREILDAAGALKNSLTAIEEALFKTEPQTDLHYTEKLMLSGRMAALKFAVDFSDYAPTTQAVVVYEELAERIDQELERYRACLETDLAALNEKIRSAQVPTIAPAPLRA
jgi:hypothetical protein